MIYEYALEPEMVAKWGNVRDCRFFIDAFGIGKGRVVSRYPRHWVRMVWTAFESTDDMERKRLEELLARMKEASVKRKNYHWDDSKEWLSNAVIEHERHPFRRILARANPNDDEAILQEDDIAISPCPGWDTPHGKVVVRNAQEMAEALAMLLGRCRWVKFVDPYFVLAKTRHRSSLSAFLRLLAAERPVGPPDAIEIHTGDDGASSEWLRDSYEKAIPKGLRVTLFRWRERPNGQRLHNRYILTDLGGVTFLHGLDSGHDGESDDIMLLDKKQYETRCRQYDPATTEFDPAAEPMLLIGRRTERP